jgi:hypothetical protein
MECRHCLVAFHDKRKVIPLGDDVDRSWAIFEYICPACKKMNLELVNALEVTAVKNEYHVRDSQIISIVPIRPRGSSRPPCPKEVPDEMREDYEEACMVLPHSPKASAALSRRCLQNLLRSAAKVTPRDLMKEIDDVMKSGSLPLYLVEDIDAVRNIGNFAAHPIKSKNTGEILPVEPREAEWNLDVLEGLFDFYYVQPAKAKEKRDALNAKLVDAGKPPIKTP